MAPTVGGVFAGEVPLDRVVAVVGTLPDGRMKVGSGFLVTARLVLTAWHCTVQSADAGIAFPPEKLQIRRYSAGVWQCAPASRVRETVNGKQRTSVSWAKPTTPEGYDWGRDVAVLEVVDPPWGDPGWAVPEYRRLDRSRTGDPVDCVAVGYPMYMVAPDAPLLKGEVRGFIRFADDHEAGRLTLRDSSTGMPAAPPHLDPGQAGELSAWGGLSGAAVFHHGRILGHVVQHHPHRSPNQVTVIPIERIAEGARKPDSASALIARLIGLPSLAALPAAAVNAGAPALEKAQIPVPPNPSPAMLLRPEFAVAPFFDRVAELEEFRVWLHDDQQAALWLWHGPAGVGKTRLAAKCVSEAADAGWMAGFAARDTGSAAEAFAAAQADTVPLLLVLDEAHQRPTQELVSLLRELVAHSLARARVLLLARTAGAWWEVLREAGADSSPGVSALLAFQQVRCLGSVAVASEEVRSVASALSGNLGIEPAPKELVGLGVGSSQETFLELELRALRAVLGKGPAAVDDSESWLLAREAARWHGAPASLGGGVPGALGKQLVGLACLVGGVELSNGRARAILRLLPDLSDARQMTVTTADSWLQGLYPGPGRWPPLRPDRIADRLLAVLGGEANFRAMLSQLADSTSDTCLGEVLMVVGRAAETDPACQETLLAPIVAGSPEACLRQAIALGGRSGHNLPDGIARWLEQHPHPAVAERCERLLPSKSFNLDRLAHTLRRQALHSELAQEGVRRAELLESLGEAAGLEEAVSIRSAAAASHEPEARRALALAWSDLARAREGERDFQGASDAADEALRISDALSAEGWSWARSQRREVLRARVGILQNRGETKAAFKILNALVDEAQQAVKEGAEHERQSLRAEFAQLLLERGIAAARDPYRQLNLRAKKDFEQARDLFAELAATNPDRFADMRPACLLDLAAIQQQMGQYDEGVRVAEEAITLLRPMARARAGYETQLAGALQNLGNLEACRKKWSAAETAFSEAADLLRERADPRGFAAMLSSVAKSLCEQGQYEQARERAGQAIRHLLPYAESAPGGFVSVAQNLLQSHREAAGHLGVSPEDEASARLAVAVQRVLTS